MFTQEWDIGEPTSICSVTYFLKIVKFERRRDMQKQIEQTLDSREVAEMEIGRAHV